MTDWTLFIDESGSVEDADDLHVVAGLLLATDDTTSLASTLRQRLEAIYPLWPYPPHAAPLNLPTSRVAALLRGQVGEGEAAAWLAARSGPLKDYLQRSKEPAARRFRSEVKRWTRGGREPGFDTLRAADCLLRQALPTEHARLESECLQQERRVRELLSALGEVPKTQATVLAGVSLPGAPDVPPDGLAYTGKCGIRRDRYVRALEVLLGRAFLLLQRERAQVVRLFVATRTVGVRAISPRRGGLDLYPHYVGDIALQAAEGLPTLAAAPRFVPVGSPNRYDASVHPGIVLADWIANRARRALMARPKGDPVQTLTDHGALGLAASPLPVVLTGVAGGPLPTVGVDGAARRAIRAALSGGDVVNEPLRPAWVETLSRPWLQSAGEWAR